MRARTLGILMLLVALSSGAAVFVLSRGQEDPRFALINQPVFPGLIDQVNDITELSVDGPKGQLTIVRDGKLWRVRESDAHLASPNEVFKAIVGIAELAYFEPKTEQPAKYYRLKLGDAEGGRGESTRVKLKIGERTVADVIVGQEKLFLPGLTVGGVYFRLPDQALSWLGRGNPEAGAEPKDWLAREIADVDGKRVRRVTVRHPGGEVVVVSKQTPMAENFSLEDIPPGTRLRYESDANHIGEILQQLEMDDAREAANMSLDWSDALVAEVETFDGLIGILETVIRGGESWARLRFQGSSEATLKEAAAAAEKTANWVYLMPKYEVVPILRRMTDLVVPENAS
jgi:hypothetical protein